MVAVRAVSSGELVNSSSFCTRNLAPQRPVNHNHMVDFGSRVVKGVIWFFFNEQYTTNRRYYVVDVVFGDYKTLKMSF